MPTPYADIFKKYNSMVEDAQLLSALDDDEYTELLRIFLSKSRSVYFKSCRKDLMNTDDDLNQFNIDLDEQEQWILATGMRLVWYEKQLYKEQKLRDRMGTRDYSVHSPANLIDKLATLKNDTKLELRLMSNDYTFDDFEGFK